MANYSQLKADIASVVKTNGAQEITGANLQQVLVQMISNSVGTGYLYKGVAVTTDNPGTPDQNVFYLATAGTYTNFGGLVIPDGSLGVLRFNGTWAADSIEFGSGDAVLYTPQSLTEQEKNQALQNLGVNNTRYQVLNVRLNANTGAYVAYNNGALCVPVKKGDKIEIINTLNSGTFVTFTTELPVVGTTSDSSSNIRNTNILYTADADGYVTVSAATNIVDYVTVYLNGLLISEAGTYKGLTNYADSKMQQEPFPVITEMVQGSLSSSTDTTQAKTKNYIPGRCVVVVGDDYSIFSFEISNQNNVTYYRRQNLPNTFITNVATFNYATPIKFAVKRRDGAAMSSSEYASIIQSITPYVGEFPYSSGSVKVHPTIAPDVVDYLTNVVYTDDYTYSAVATALQNHTFNELPFERCLPVRLDWTPLNDVRNYIVILDTQSGGGVTLSKTPYFTDKNSIDIYNLLPNTTYNYIVIAVGIDGKTQMIAFDKFTTADTPLRILNLPNTTNVRDLGGWVAGTKKVKYGRLFRGAAMSRREGFVIADEGIDQACRFLHIAKEIGLGVNYPASPITGTTQFVDIPISAYYLGVKPISEGGTGANYVRIFGEIISTLSDNTTDSVIFHCAGGADRTGTLSWLLLGLLGVSESDMSKDYELTSFTKSANRRVRNSAEFIEMVNYINTLTGTTIQEKIEAWWLAQGATSAQITSFRNLMLQ